MDRASSAGMGRPRRIICIAYHSRTHVLELTTHHKNTRIVNCWYRVVTNLELSHGVGQPLCTASAGNETNRHLRKTKATVVRCENEVALRDIS